MPNLKIEGSASLNTVANISGLGVNGKISNTNNTICMISKIDVQWGKVDTSNNNAFTAYSGFFGTTTKFTIQPSVVVPNLNWDYSTTTQAKTLFNNSGYTLGANEKFAAKVTVNYSYYEAGNPMPKTDKAEKLIINP